MGAAEVDQAVQAAMAAFNGTAGQGWKNTSVEEAFVWCASWLNCANAIATYCWPAKCATVARYPKLAEGDFAQIRLCAEYFSGVATRAELGDGEALQ